MASPYVYTKSLVTVIYHLLVYPALLFCHIIFHQNLIEQLFIFNICDINKMNSKHSHKLPKNGQHCVEFIIGIFNFIFDFSLANNIL